MRSFFCEMFFRYNILYIFQILNSIEVVKFNRRVSCFVHAEVPLHVMWMSPGCLHSHFSVLFQSFSFFFITHSQVEKTDMLCLGLHKLKVYPAKQVFKNHLQALDVLAAGPLFITIITTIISIICCNDSFPFVLLRGHILVRTSGPWLYIGLHLAAQRFSGFSVNPALCSGLLGCLMLT